jgi:hypothetical protein
MKKRSVTILMKNTVRDGIRISYLSGHKRLERKGFMRERGIPLLGMGNNLHSVPHTTELVKGWRPNLMMGMLVIQHGSTQSGKEEDIYKGLPPTH